MQSAAERPPPPAPRKSNYSELPPSTSLSSEPSRVYERVAKDDLSPPAPQRLGAVVLTILALVVMCVCVALDRWSVASVCVLRIPDLGVELSDTCFDQQLGLGDSYGAENSTMHTAIAITAVLLGVAGAMGMVLLFISLMRWFSRASSSSRLRSWLSGVLMVSTLGALVVWLVAGHQHIGNDAATVDFVLRDEVALVVEPIIEDIERNRTVVSVPDSLIELSTKLGGTFYMDAYPFSEGTTSSQITLRNWHLQHVNASTVWPQGTQYDADSGRYFDTLSLSYGDLQFAEEMQQILPDNFIFGGAMPGIAPHNFFEVDVTQQPQSGQCAFTTATQGNAVDTDLYVDFRLRLQCHGTSFNFSARVTGLPQGVTVPVTMTNRPSFLTSSAMDSFVDTNVTSDGVVDLGTLWKGYPYTVRVTHMPASLNYSCASVSGRMSGHTVVDVACKQGPPLETPTDAITTPPMPSTSSPTPASTTPASPAGTTPRQPQSTAQSYGMIAGFPTDVSVSLGISWFILIGAVALSVGAFAIFCKDCCQAQGHQAMGGLTSSRTPATASVQLQDYTDVDADEEYDAADMYRPSIAPVFQ